MPWISLLAYSYGKWRLLKLSVLLNFMAPARDGAAGLVCLNLVTILCLKNVRLLVLLENAVDQLRLRQYAWESKLWRLRWHRPALSESQSADKATLRIPWAMGPRKLLSWKNGGKCIISMSQNAPQRQEPCLSLKMLPGLKSQVLFPEVTRSPSSCPTHFLGLRQFKEVDTLKMSYLPLVPINLFPPIKN